MKILSVWPLVEMGSASKTREMSEELSLLSGE